MQETHAKEAPEQGTRRKHPAARSSTSNSPACTPRSLAHTAHLQSECIEKAEKHAKFRSLMIPEGEVRDEHVGYWPATTHFLVMYACIQEGIPMNHASGVLIRA